MATTTPVSRRVPRAVTAAPSLGDGAPVGSSIGRPPGRASRRAGGRLPVLLAVLALTGVAAGVAVTRSGGGDGLVGDPAPSFSLPDVREPGTTVTLTPGRPTVVNFFAAWCIPCRDELPVLEQAARRRAGTVSFVGIDVNDSRSAASDLLSGAGVTFPAGYDPDRSVAARYRLQGMPTTVFIDADGRVADVARGRLTTADLDRRLDRLATAGGVGTS